MRLRHLYNRWISPQRWLERAGVRAPMQIVIGLVVLTSCVLLVAKAIKLIPDADETSLRGRIMLAEMASSQAASAVARQDSSAALGSVLDALVHRYDDILSARLRRRDGTIVAETADHAKYWSVAQPHVNTPTQMQIVLYQNQKPWGQFEICFRGFPQQSTWAAWWSTPMVQLMAFVIAAVFLLFWIYLSRALTMLDPSGVVPQRMQLLMDTLVEGMVVLDDQDRIVMANRSFASTAFVPVERLIGRKLSSLPWLAPEGDGAPDIYPWKASGQSDLQQRGVPIRLGIGPRHARRLNVNASPILGPEGALRGVLVTFDDQTVIETDNLQLGRFLTRFSDASQEIRLLYEQVQSNVDSGQTAKLNELTQAVSELTQLCQAASKNEADPVVVASEPRGGQSGVPG
jgi:PAS domain-containing protein